jgi:hypothetical protein
LTGANSAVGFDNAIVVSFTKPPAEVVTGIAENGGDHSTRQRRTLADPPLHLIRLEPSLMKSVLRFAVAVVAVGSLASAASADTLFMKALKEKYDFKIVSCNTCHAKGTDPATGEAYGKEVRNDFGKLFEPSLDEKKMHDQLHAIKDAKGDAKKPLQEKASADFLAALAVVEAMKADDGKTYGEKLKAGEIEGVKLK